MEEAGERRRRLGAALRELNETAGLGVTKEDFERAEAYATGALLESEAKLRRLVLDERPRSRSPRSTWSASSGSIDGSTATSR
jgi:hypothetical protein